MINLLIIIIILSFVITWVYAIHHVTVSKFTSTEIKTIWTALIIFIPLSSIFYLLFSNKNRVNKKAPRLRGF